jgi:hypothetical protein
MNSEVLGTVKMTIFKSIFLFKNTLNFIFNIVRENYSKRLQSMLVWIKEMEENENLHVEDGNFY